MTRPRHFLDLHNVDRGELRRILSAAHALKKDRGAAQEKPLAGKKLAMIFEKTSLRTRASFEVGMVELGGYPLYLNSGDLQLGIGETIADTAKVLSRYVDALLLRCYRHEDLLDLAAYADVPVINALSNRSHPCQLMADIMTVEEKMGSVKGRTVAWIGDGNNMANSWIQAAFAFDFSLRLCCPAGLQPHKDDLAYAEGQHADVRQVGDRLEAARDADIIVTDTWVSMGDTGREQRIRALTPYQVDQRVMDAAKAEAIFMHCLPAHRGEEVTAEVMDGPQSVVWDEAENRLHVQKAILLWCLKALKSSDAGI